jgi:glutaminase
MLIADRKSLNPLVVVVLTSVLLVPLSLSAQTARSPVAPRRELVEQVVREACEKFKLDASGKNADYIPYLAQVDSKLFAIAIVTTDNQVLTLGDVNYSFSIQSISKVFTLALAMEELGPDTVFQKIGSDDPMITGFNPADMYPADQIAKRSCSYRLPWRTQIPYEL